jgi:Zn-dependent M28 family amino/carboxypeptidase
VKTTTSIAILSAAALAASVQAAQPAQPAKSAATAPAPARARASAVLIEPSHLSHDVKVLASDEFEGRGPNTPGEAKTVQYIINQFESAGLKPGGDLANGKRSWTQDVPLGRFEIKGPVEISIKGAGREQTLTQGEEIAVRAAMTGAKSVEFKDAPLVFVGYGVTAPERKWDDFKGQDLKGKLAVVLINDPDFETGKGEFGGKAMTYYGRWTYKYEELARRGALGTLIVHETAPASYGWATVKNSNANVQYDVVRKNPLEAHAPVEAWIQRDLAVDLFKRAGLDFEQAKLAAQSRDFKPVELKGVTLSTHFSVDAKVIKSKNVVAIKKGSKHPDEYVIYSAHWDHLGIGPPVNGDSIYNGAADNASGTAAVIAIARAAAKLAPTRRTQLFVFVTAEESGLLGSAWFATHPTVPVKQIIADLNLDVVPLEGRMKDYVVLGSNKSTLGAEFSHLMQVKGMSLTADPHPEAGHFYRSDHFSFAKAGVPAISIGAGTDYVGRPKGWGEAQQADYTAHRYHQPSDEYKPDFDLSGATQLADIVLSFGRALANSPLVPEWNAGAEFKAMRDSTGGPAK